MAGYAIFNIFISTSLATKAVAADVSRRPFLLRVFRQSLQASFPSFPSVESALQIYPLIHPNLMSTSISMATRTVAADVSRRSFPPPSFLSSRSPCTIPSRLRSSDFGFPSAFGFRPSDLLPYPSQSFLSPIPNPPPNSHRIFHPPNQGKNHHLKRAYQKQIHPQRKRVKSNPMPLQKI